MIPYLVCRFSKSTLSNLVKECFGSFFPDILKKEQIDYVVRYLQDIDAKSILLEFDYIDKDFLEDYSRYYVKSFGNNGHKCARLHFFSMEVTHENLNELLIDSDPTKLEELKSNYLGFMVIKPLPKTFIGRTCLKIYPAFNEKMGNKHCLTRTYKIDLFGIPLQVDSIAFQEQDQVVSACATTAIWSALHALPYRDIRDISACSIITTNAINHIDGSSNSFPNEGLTNKQILRAIDCEKLRHHEEPINGVGQKDFMDTVRYHIDSGFPLILGVTVCSVEKGTAAKNLGGHAVTIVGYESTKNSQTVYVHDDRLGPYARASFVMLNDYGCDEEKLKKWALDGEKKWGLALQKKDDQKVWLAPYEVLIPNSLIIPTPQKVRLKSTYAVNTCKLIVSEYELWLKEAKADEYMGQLQYSIRLVDITKIRQEIKNREVEDVESTRKMQVDPLTAEDLEFLGKQKSKFLTGSYARHQWMASFSFREVPAFRIFFDATDIPQGDAVSSIYIENLRAYEATLGSFKEYAKSNTKICEPHRESFYGSFLKYLREPDGTYFDHLDKLYGELRAPKYLKDDEINVDEQMLNQSLKLYYEPVKESLEVLCKDLVMDDDRSFAIWAIAQDGAILIGREIGQKGHPSLTGFKPARIAGELKRTANGWCMNPFSGRYSGDYSNKNSFLENARNKFESIFRNTENKIYVFNE